MRHIACKPPVSVVYVSDVIVPISLKRFMVVGSNGVQAGKVSEFKGNDVFAPWREC